MEAHKTADEVGHNEARSGQVDVTGWIMEGKIPLRAYLQDRLRDGRDEATVPKEMQFNSHLATRRRRSNESSTPDVRPLQPLGVFIFDCSEWKKVKKVFVNVPAEFAKSDLSDFLDNAVDELFGFE